MTISRDAFGDNNVARLNAFLDQFPESCDPDFDDTGEALERELSRLCLDHTADNGDAYA